MQSRNMLLLVSHVLFVGILVPSLACGVYLFLAGEWSTAGLLAGEWSVADLLGGFFGAFLLGMILQFFNWYFSFPFAVLTVVICFLLCEMNLTRLRVWVSCGAFLGIGYPVFFACCTGDFPATTLLITGVIMGVFSGGILHYFWTDLYPPRA